MMDNIQITADVAAGVSVVATIVGLLPPAVALLGLIWYCIQIWESKTVQSLICKVKTKFFA